MTDDRDEIPAQPPAPRRRSARTGGRSGAASGAPMDPREPASDAAALTDHVAARAKAEAATDASTSGGAADEVPPGVSDPVGPAAGVPLEPVPVIEPEPRGVAPARRGVEVWSCPLLRRLGDEGRLGEPLSVADPWHRCAAETPPSPLSDRQQTLVCLTESHVDCPRYRHAAAPVPVPQPRATQASRPSPATLAATVVLLTSFLAAMSFVAVNGGIAVPTPRPTDQLAVASQTPRPSPAASSSARPSAGSSSSPTVQPSASPAQSSPSPSPSPTPPASASPSPPRPSPSSDRYLLLKPCPDRPDCYLYTVRRGDNFTSIGLYFGVPRDVLLARNPWIRDPARIKAGDVIEMPPPTR